MARIGSIFLVIVGLCVLASVPAQAAQKTFRVCRGENADQCPGHFDVFVGCAEIGDYVPKFCPRGVGARSIVPLATHDGNRCGYTVVEVTCNPEIAPSGFFDTAGVILAATATVVSVASIVWVLWGWSAADPSNTGSARAVRSRKFRSRIEALGDPSHLFRILAMVGGLLGLMLSGIVLYYRAIAQQHLGLLDLFITPAFAADPSRDMAGLIPYVAAGVLTIMGISFLTALGTLLVLPDNKQNQARIKAADNIVKTFGGFFTGLATTLLK